MAFSNTLAAASRGLRSINIYIPGSVQCSTGRVSMRSIMSGREEVCWMGKKSAEEGLTVGMGANFSVSRGKTQGETRGGIMIVKATGKRAEELRPEHCTLVDMKSGELIPVFGEELLQPSCEKHVHRAAYMIRPDIRAIVHAHNFKATAFANFSDLAPLGPGTPDYVAVLGNMLGIPAIGYHTPSTQDLASAVADVIKDHSSVLMGKHGVFCVGGNGKEAFDRAHLIERTADTFLSMYLIILASGKTLKDIPTERYLLSEEDSSWLDGSNIEKVRREAAAQHVE